MDSLSINIIITSDPYLNLFSIMTKSADKIMKREGKVFFLFQNVNYSEVLVVIIS